jgi:hypothetical protein
MPRIYDSPILIDAPIGENLGETKEGYLVAKNVKLARVGRYEYLKSEIGMDGEGVIGIFREDQDVFAHDAMASFEGKPVVETHPSEDVTIDNHSNLARGHAQNIRKEKDYLVGDLVITDPILIHKIKNKEMRAVSLGYDADLKPHRGGFKQFNIRGNHIAVVEKGRAGPNVKIKDSLPINRRRNLIMSKTEAYAQMLHAYVQSGATADEVAKIMKTTFKDSELFPEEKVKEGAEGTGSKTLYNEFLDWVKDKVKDKKSKDEPEEKDEKEKKYEDMKRRLDAMEEEMADRKKRDKHKDKHRDEDEEKEEHKKELEDALKAVATGDEDEDEDEKEKKYEDESEYEDEKEEKEDREEEGYSDRKKHKDAVKSALLKLKPTLARMPQKYRDQVIDAFADMMGRTSNTGNYSKASSEGVRRQRTHDTAIINFEAEAKKLGAEIQAQYHRKHVEG